MKRNIAIAVALALLVLAQLACGIDWGNKPAPAPVVPTSAPVILPTIMALPSPTDEPTVVPGPTEDPCTGLSSMIYFAKASEFTKQFLVVLDETPKYIPTNTSLPIVPDKVQFERDTANSILAQQKALNVPPLYKDFQDHRVKAMEAFVSALDNALNGDRITMSVYFQIMIEEEKIAEEAAKAIDVKCGFKPADASS